MVHLFELCEIAMLLCFGFSWPLSAIKSYRTRTTKGKSLPFLVLILLGYVAGITSKLLNPNGFKWYVMFFYVLNFCFVSIDFSLYFRNLCLDRQAAEDYAADYEKLMEISARREELDAALLELYEQWENQAQ